MYADYMKEIYGREVITTEAGFVAYTAKDAEGTVVIHSIYVAPEGRRKGVTAHLEGLVIAKEDPTFLMGYVDLTSSTPERSIMGLIKSGYLITRTNGDIIYLGKQVKK